MDLLRLEQVKKNFGGVTACRNVDFAVKRDSIVGLIGPNGAGKTTIFNLITGVYAPTSGEILFEGKNLLAMSMDEIRDIRGKEISMIFQ